MTSDDVRAWLDDQDRELTGCVEDLAIIESDLKDIADSLERFIEDVTRSYNTYYSESIRKQIRGIESVRKRIDTEV